MQIARKVQIAKKSVTSFTRHDDEDSTMRIAAINEMRRFLQEEEDGIIARNQAAIEAELGIDADGDGDTDGVVE